MCVSQKSSPITHPWSPKATFSWDEQPILCSRCLFRLSAFNCESNKESGYLGRTHRHSAPGHSAFGHSAPGHSAPRTLRSQDIQLPGHSGLLDIQVFRTLRSQDIQLPGHSGLLDIQLFWTSRSFGHPALLDIQVFWTSRSFGHPGLSDFQFLFLIVKMLVMSCYLITLFGAIPKV